MSPSSLSTKEDVKKAALLRMEAYNRNAEDEGQGSAKLIEVNGKTCLQHEVQPSDSLPRLGLTYNVSEREIRNLNKLFSDQIHHLDHINIPMNEGFKFTGREKMKEDDALKIEKEVRDHAIFMMAQYIGEQQGRPETTFKAEALFYCEDNGYDYRKAKEAYDADRDFERQQKRKR